MKASDNSIISPSPEEKQFILEPNLLVDRITRLLWDHIVHGRIHPGTRLVERQLADELGISRVPVREALIQLEKEGLIVSRPNGRYVIELGEEEINKLYAVRGVLERLAVELATQNTSPEYANALENKLREMREAVAHQDLGAFSRNDLEIHRLIWLQANNPYLLDVLRTLTGPIYMFIADNAAHFAWGGILELHENLINCINSGDVRGALEAIHVHMDDGLHRSSQVFRNGKQRMSSQNHKE